MPDFAKPLRPSDALKFGLSIGLSCGALDGVLAIRSAGAMIDRAGILAVSLVMDAAAFAMAADVVGASDGEHGEGPSSQPNILLISVDTLRPNHLSAYGYSRDTSPVLQGRAREGVLFQEADLRSTWTLRKGPYVLNLHPSFNALDGKPTQDEDE